MSINSKHAVIRFGLKESFKSLEKKPLKESTVMLFFSSNKKRFKKSTGLKCSLNSWDKERQRVKTSKGMVPNTHKANQLLNEIESFLVNEYFKMMEDGTLNLNDLKKRVGDRILGKTEFVDEKKDDLISFCEGILKLKKSSISITTQRSYSQAIRILRSYSENYSVKLSFDDIDMQFYRRFCKHMEGKNYSLNSIGKHVKNLKTFLNEALTMNITNNLIFKNKAFRVPKEEVVEIYLNEFELEQLAKTDLSNRPKLELARDIFFLIGCYTGQRVSDYNGLTRKNLKFINGHHIIEIKQAKTRRHGNVVHIPVTKGIKKILNKYGSNFPPKMCEPILRKNLKLAAKRAGFNKPINIQFTKGGKIESTVVPMYKLVKTHTARRSFCTNHYLKGKPLQQIMLFSGHKTEREFLKYVRVDKQQEIISVIESGFFQ
ncbi:site-specific integrase [Flavobacteriaceae bacterium GF1]